MWNKEKQYFCSIYYRVRLVLKELFDINDIMCFTFNKKGAWIYGPKITLTHLNNFIKKNKQYKARDRPWEKYFL